MNTQNKFFTVHHIATLKAGGFSAVRMNVPNTEEARVKAAEIYPDDRYLIEYHDGLKLTDWVISKNYNV